MRQGKGRKDRFVMGVSRDPQLSANVFTRGLVSRRSCVFALPGDTLRVLDYRNPRRHGAAVFRDSHLDA